MPAALLGMENSEKEKEAETSVDEISAQMSDLSTETPTAAQIYERFLEVKARTPNNITEFNENLGMLAKLVEHARNGGHSKLARSLAVFREKSKHINRRKKSTLQENQEKADRFLN
jgi:hypothetical protein